MLSFRKSPYSGHDIQVYPGTGELTGGVQLPQELHALEPNNCMYLDQGFYEILEDAAACQKTADVLAGVPGEADRVKRLLSRREELIDRAEEMIDEAESLGDAARTKEEEERKQQEITDARKKADKLLGGK